MKIPLWIRRLPHNLSTLRPFIRLGNNSLFWSLGVYLYFWANRGDENYLFHFEETGLSITLGPLEFTIGLTDTPEENAWIP